MSERYTPRADRTRWARDQILAALRVHGMLTIPQMAESIGCDTRTLATALYAMVRYKEITRQRLGLNEVVWQLGPNAPAQVDVEHLEPFPLQ